MTSEINNVWELDSEAEEVVYSDSYISRYIEGNQKLVIDFNSLNEQQKIFYASMCDYIDSKEDVWEVYAPVKLLLDRLTLSSDLDKLSNTIH